MLCRRKASLCGNPRAQAILGHTAPLADALPPGKRPKYNLYEIERLAKLGTPLAQLVSKFGISYEYRRSVSCHQKWGIARIYGYKHRFRKVLLPSLAQKVPQVDHSQLFG